MVGYGAGRTGPDWVMRFASKGFDQEYSLLCLTEEPPVGGKGEKREMKLENKVAIVTGGGNGIGRAIALGFGREGADVVVAARRLPLLEQVAKEIEALGSKSLAIKTDVSRKRDVRNLVECTISEFGKIDILVNNAAIFPPTPFLEINEVEWDMVNAVILKGTFFCCQAVLRHMVDQKSGRIINLNSGAARSGELTVIDHYVAAKGGVLSLTHVLSEEFSRHGITVNGIACGLTYTEGVQSIMPKEFFDQFAQKRPLRRNGRPEDYVGMAVLLASDEGSFITGQTISVDGGLTMP